MHNLLKIVARYSNFLVFMILEVAAFMIIAYNNAYPRSSVLSTANTFVAWQNEKVNEIRTYFSLQYINEQLASENAGLRERLAAIEGDSTYYFQSAKVVQMTTNRLHNYLTINRGEEDGIQIGQGILNAEGAVGIVRTVGEHYSIVLPLINTHTQLSCRFKKNDYIGTLRWNGDDCRLAQLADIANHMAVEPGDTIVTSGLSPVFPEGIPVGTVEKCSLKEGDSYYTIEVRLYADFKRLKYVEVVQNTAQKELEDLEYGLD